MGGWPAGYLQSVEELNSGPPKTNPSSGREQDLNPWRPDYESDALPLGHACLLNLRIHKRVVFQNAFVLFLYVIQNRANNSYNLIGSLTTLTVTLAWVFFRAFFLSFESLEKINKLFTDLRSYCEKLWSRTWKCCPRPRSQFFTIRTYQRITYIYIEYFHQHKSFTILFAYVNSIKIPVYASKGYVALQVKFHLRKCQLLQYLTFGEHYTGLIHSYVVR